MHCDGFIFISLRGEGGLPVILKAIMENDVQDNFLQYLLGVGDVSFSIQKKEGKESTTSELEKRLQVRDFREFFSPKKINNNNKKFFVKLQGSTLHDLDKMDCKQMCKAANVILHKTFSANQLAGDHKLYAQPLMHPFTNYLLNR